MSNQWETFCDVGYYHMWRLRRKNERGWNDGFHINTRDEAQALCQLLNKLERELTEALSDLEFRRDLFKLQEQQLNDVRAERDRLAEAALAVVDRWETPFWKQVEHTGVYIAALRKAVAAGMEGGNDD
jgi:hypothetical protein